MININTIAANIAAIFFICLSFILSAHAEEHHSSFKIDCEQASDSNIISIQSFIGNVTKSTISTSNRSSINMQTSPESKSMLSFSLDNFPILIDISSNNKSTHFLINKSCSITEKNLTFSLKQDVKYNKNDINRDIQSSNIDINESSQPQLELKPYSISYYPTIITVPKGYSNDYSGTITSLDSFIYLSFEGSYHELITIKQN